MNQRDHILAIDAGTQSLRAMIFDGHGNTLAKAQIFYPAPMVAKAGWAEQSVESFWNVACQACRQLWEGDHALRKRLGGVAVTSQRGSMVNLDADGQPLRPAILWLDQRRTDGLPPLGGWWGLLFRLAGVHHTVSHLQANAESNWIRVHQPQIWDATEKLLLISGYLNYRLTSVYKDSLASQVAYLPFDVKRGDWAKPGDWKWRALGIHPSQLPALVKPGAPIGTVSEAASHATGLPAGLPVVAAAADKACEVLGSGCHQLSSGHVSMGTAATFNITSPRYFEPEAFIPPYPAGIPGHFSVETQTFRGFWMVSWFLEQFGQPECQWAKAQGQPPEHFLERLLEETPPGADGLVLQPTWSPGIKTPGPEARGAIVGFNAYHTRAHLYRAMIEGQMFALRAAKERIARRGRLEVTQLRCSGGASQSDGVLQIAADIFGLPATRPHLYETSALGAAMIAAVGLGQKSSFDEAINTMTRSGPTFEPKEAHRKVYEQQYRNVFIPMYKRLKPLYASLLRMHG